MTANKKQMKDEERSKRQHQEFLNSLVQDNSALKDVDSVTDKTGARNHKVKYAIILINEFFHDLNDTLRKNRQKE